MERMVAGVFFTQGFLSNRLNWYYCFHHLCFGKFCNLRLGAWHCPKHFRFWRLKGNGLGVYSHHFLPISSCDFYFFFTAGKTWQAKERFLFLKNWRSTTKPSIKSVHHKISPLSSRSFSNPETLKTFRCQWDVKTSTVSARSHSQLNGIEAHGKYGCLGCPLVIQLGNECPKFSIGHKGIHLQL